ncbi:radical SAM protein [Candidatus Woesearchaeota archaeon]|nr:radical SAM protein [Candidatus Woesearchaeota archaeon]
MEIKQKTQMEEETVRHIQKVAFVYLSVQSTSYVLTDDLGYAALRRPQLGLQYMCAVLEKKGIQTNIYDQSVHNFSFNWLAEQLKDYDMVGFSCSDAQEGKVKEYCTKLKEKSNIITVIGGPSTFWSTNFLDHHCDMVIHGEAEITISEIVDYYEGKLKLVDLKGVSYKHNGETIKAPPQPLVQNLDDLPFPDRSKVDITAYHDYFLFGMRKPYITMTASRGCIYRCSYCSSPTLWNLKDRRRSVDNVIAEIDEVVPKYGIKYIAFQDDIFGITPDWIQDFCAKLIAKPYKVRWMCIIHPLTLKGDDIVKTLTLMRKAGCDTLSFGLQSADAEVLKNIARYPSEPENLKKVLHEANKLKFVTGVAFIFGLPGDTYETMKKTKEFALTSEATLVNFFTLTILRGSPMEKQFKSEAEACSIPQEELLQLTQQASKEFYTNPKVLARITTRIIRNNPSWPFKVSATCLPSILGRIGFAHKKKTRQGVGRVEETAFAETT